MRTVKRHGSRQVFAPGGIASDSWWENDSDLRFTLVSDRLHAVLGLPYSLVCNRRPMCPRTDYDDPAWRAHLDDLENRRLFRNFETTVIDASGASRPVMISGTPKLAADGTFEGYIGVGDDLTELRRHEAEASRTAANLEFILDNIDQGVLLFDATPGRVLQSPPGRLASGPGSDMRGISYDDVLRHLAQRGEYANGQHRGGDRLSPEPRRSGKRFVVERKRADGRPVR